MRKNITYENPPAQVEVLFNLGDTNLAMFSLWQVPVLLRIGESIILAQSRKTAAAVTNVVGLRHECNDRDGTASPMLIRVTVLVKRRTGKE